MSNTASNQENLYSKLLHWLDDVNAHEMTDFVEFIEHAKAYFNAAEALPEAKVKQFIDNFTYDLNEFYRQNQSDAKHSVYLGLLNETLWLNLARMTDKSQVEWAELSDDFQHQGTYQTGDVIGFGELACKKCQQTITIYHLSEVSDCANCGGSEFFRHPLSP